MDLLLWWTLTLLFLVADPSCFGLQITNLAKIKPYCTGSKRVCFRFASIFLEGCPESSDESVETAPGLAKRTRAGSWGIWVSIKRTDWSMHFGLTKLIEIAKEFKDMSATAPGEREGRSMVVEILTKGLPVSTLLVLIAARSSR